MQRLPRPAQYLLRVDDLCPSVSQEHWASVRDLIRQFGIRPILAVIPDNQDRELGTSPLIEHFWEEMGAMQREGATIALHGYQHRCTSRAKSLLPLHSRSEFAGYPIIEQRNRLRNGLALLRSRGLNPRLFVAPNHSFDQVTLRALRAEGLLFLSDGFARIPFIRDGVTWIPQQIWEPARRDKGLWTICLHPNSAGSERLKDLRHFIKKHGDQFTSFEKVIEGLAPERLSLAERLHEQMAMWRVVYRFRRQRPRL